MQTTEKGLEPNARFFSLRVRGEVPSPRERHTASLLGKRIHIFGGYQRKSDLYFDNMSVFDTETLTYIPIECRGNIPEKRCGHSSFVVDNRIWIFGGRVKVKMSTGFLGEDITQYRNDLYCYDPLTNEWIRYEPTGHGPTPRALATATVVGKKIYIFGGANTSGNRHDPSGFCDLYELDLETMSWTEVEPKTTPPQPCYGHTATYVGDGKILVFGGKGYQVMNNIYIFDVEARVWTQYAFAGNVLIPRWGHSATFHRNRYILIYGGRDDDGYFNSLDVIDLQTQLIELKEEEQAKWEQQSEKDMNTYLRDALTSLQVDVEELRSMVGQVGDELLHQQTENMEMNSVFSQLKKNHLELRKRASELFSQQTSLLQVS
eukprot:TRINITY_DN1305_c0_g1_i7.p1 TRINITY_DN1305_c0_g1~~TRINITY_DN1305_c0_g1_i7.p1  ORF type:complete len:375 (-),score=79.34 TRINITY_DN1305_c0_g1_i7:165-1289(-)